MNETMNMQKDGKVSASATTQPTRPSWARPTLTRIEMKRTLHTAGSGHDLPTHKTVP